MIFQDEDETAPEAEAEVIAEEIIPVESAAPVKKVVTYDVKYDVTYTMSHTRCHIREGSRSVL